METAQPLDSLPSSTCPEVHQGQFGTFTITEADRRSVLIYRGGLLVAALNFSLGTGLVLWGSSTLATGQNWTQILTPLYACYCLGLGISLWTIHIYLAFLHRVLQVFWWIGAIAAVSLAIASPDPLAITVYHHPITLLGIGCTFAAFTGIAFKEAFCFSRWETKLLTPMIPGLLLGHLLGVLPLALERATLALCAGLFLVFALRKLTQPISPDIGDKSVFAYLQSQRQSSHIGMGS